MYVCHFLNKKTSFLRLLPVKDSLNECDGRRSIHKREEKRKENLWTITIGLLVIEEEESNEWYYSLQIESNSARLCRPNGEEKRADWWQKIRWLYSIDSTCCIINQKRWKQTYSNRWASKSSYDQNVDFTSWQILLTGKKTFSVFFPPLRYDFVKTFIDFLIVWTCFLVVQIEINVIRSFSSILIVHQRQH